MGSAIRFVLGVGLLLAATTAWAATPTLVQHVSTGGMGNDSGNGININFPNVTGARNLLVLGITYTRTATVSTIADDKSNRWTLGVSCDNGTSLKTDIYYSAGAAGGTQLITVTFSGNVVDFHATATEFYNASTNPTVLTTKNASALGPSVTAGSFSPTSGDLIYNYAIDTNAGTSGNITNPSSITAGSGFSLLTADLRLGVVTQYRTAPGGAVNPTATVTGDTDSFNAVAISFTSASAGTAPPAGIRIQRVYHGNMPWDATTSYKAQFASTGNLLVFLSSYGSVYNNFSAIIDTNLNTWTKVTTNNWNA